MQAIEHELEVASRVHEVRSEYECQMKERATMAKEVAQLKEEAQNLKQMNLSGGSQMMSPVQEAHDFLHWRTCQLLHPVPLSQWRRICLRQKRENELFVAEGDGIKFVHLLKLRMS